MLKNYLKIAVRNLLKNKIFSSINIIGLALGMATAILILLWVQAQLNYDGFFKDRDSIYRVTCKAAVEGGAAQFPYAPFPLADAMVAEIPEVEDAAVFDMYSPTTVRVGDKVFKENRVAGAGKSFFRILPFPLIDGNPQKCLTEPYSVVLTESAAKKYFGDEDPLNKSLLIDGVAHKVTGVMKDIPQQSHLQFNLITSTDLLRDQNSHNWGSLNFPCYVKLKPNSSIEDVDRKIEGILQRNIPEIVSNLKLQTALQPLASIHGTAGYSYDYAAVLDRKYVVIFSIVALLVVGIAIMNFINLSTAVSSTRAKEVGVRKVVGSTRAQLIKQFITEAVSVSFVAFALAMVMVELALPVFNQISGEETYLNLANPRVPLGLIGILLLSGLFAGSYPAVFLSSFNPVSILKKSFYPGSRKVVFRKALVLFQFAISICLIASTIVVTRQLNYMENKNLGFDKDNVVYVPLDGISLTAYESLKNNLLGNPKILSVTVADYLLTDLPNQTLTLDCSWEGKDPRLSVAIEKPRVQCDYFATLGYKLLEGRTFSPNHATADEHAFVFNEEAVKQLGIKDPVGKQFTLQGKTGAIIGVVKNVNSRSLRYKVQPQISSLFQEFDDTERGVMLLKIKAGSFQNISEVLHDVKEMIHKYNPSYVFEYHFLDQTIQQQYSQEEKMGEILDYFTSLAVFIAALGLFGLVSFYIRSRAKEIGIRKVLGSSTTKIVFIVCRDFGWSVVMANIIAWPVAYFAMNKWLQNFAYRIDITIWPFVLAGVSALAIAMVTVSWQAIRAAMANPVEALRYE